MSGAVVIGQSHVNAIKQALGSKSGDFGPISVYRLPSKGGSDDPGTITTSDAVELVATLPSDTRVFLSRLGTYHNILGLLRSAQKFDFLLDPDDTPTFKGSVRIPHRAIASAFQTIFDDASAVFRIREASTSQPYLLSAPPPKECNQYILDSFMRQKKSSYRGQNVEEIGIGAPERRLKLWMLEVRLLRCWAESHGMKFVPAPQGAFNCGGFLSREFYGGDATHANAAYGALVLEQIRAIVQKEETDRLHV